MGERREAFERRWTQLGLGPAENPFALDATITPGDLARAMTAERSASDAPGLPRISVAFHHEPAAAREGGRPTGADLEVRALLGEGGMGRVLLARQRSLGRDVAVRTSASAAASARALRS